LIASTLDYLRRNAIAITALGCSLLAIGGAGYAAIGLPKGSVGTAQLRDGAVTPSKLNRKLVGGYVRAWAAMNSAGRITASSPKARVVGAPPTDAAYRLKWRGRFPHSHLACVALAAPSGAAAEQQTKAPVEADYMGNGSIFIFYDGPNNSFEGVQVALIC
jgi:hypothetical protein